jgi:hypothetical protein
MIVRTGEGTFVEVPDATTAPANQWRDASGSMETIQGQFHSEQAGRKPSQMGRDYVGPDPTNYPTIIMTSQDEFYFVESPDQYALWRKGQQPRLPSLNQKGEGVKLGGTGQGSSQPGGSPGGGGSPSMRSSTPMPAGTQAGSNWPTPDQLGGGPRVAAPRYDPLSSAPSPLNPSPGGDPAFRSSGSFPTPSSPAGGLAPGAPGRAGEMAAPMGGPPMMDRVGGFGSPSMSMPMPSPSSPLPPIGPSASTGGFGGGGGLSPLGPGMGPMPGQSGGSGASSGFGGGSILGGMQMGGAEGSPPAPAGGGKMPGKYSMIPPSATSMPPVPGEPPVPPVTFGPGVGPTPDMNPGSMAPNPPPWWGQLNGWVGPGQSGPMTRSQAGGASVNNGILGELLGSTGYRGR